MAKLYKTFFNWLFSKEGDKERVKYPLNPEDIEIGRINSGLVKENQTLKAQLGRISIEKAKEEQERRDDKDRGEIIDEINAQKYEIVKSKMGETPVSLRSFFELINKNPKLRKELEIVDRRDIKVFGKFGDLVIGKDGKWILLDDKGNIVITGPSLESIIRDPETLANQIKRKRIVTTLDEKGEYVPDVENELVPRVTPIVEDLLSDEEVAYEHSLIAQEKFIDAIKKREDKIRNLSDELEVHEISLGESRRMINDLKRANRILTHNSQVGQSELSKALMLTQQYEANWGEMQRKIVSLTEKGALKESLIERLEFINKELLNKLQNWGVKGDMELVQEHLQGIIEWAKANLPERVTLVQEVPKPQFEPTLPGRPIQPSQSQQQEGG